MSLRVQLPWPHKDLSPNSRVHWRALAKRKKAARAEAFFTAVTERFDAPASGRVHAAITFHPPDNRRRDADNALAACKAYCDGIADAIRVDDYRWNIAMTFAEPTPGGAVMFEINEIPADGAGSRCRR